MSSERRLHRLGLIGVGVLVTLAGIPAVAVAQTTGAVQGEVGRFVFDALAAGPVTLLFELDGFDASRIELVVQAGAESRVVGRLQLAQVTEKVVVYAPAPLPFVPPRRPPPPIVIPLTKEVMETVCQPAKLRP